MSTKYRYSKLKISHLRSLLAQKGENPLKLTRDQIISRLEFLNLSCEESTIPAKTTNFPSFTGVAYHNLDEDNVDFIPFLNFTSIYNYLVNKENPHSHEPVSNYKGLDRAVQHFEAGDVQNLQISQVSSSLVFFSGQCHASMKKIMYTVYIAATTDDCLLHSLCECPIGQGMSCSHIGAVLLALEESKRLLPLQKSTTSQLCKWKVPRPMKLEALPLQEITIKKAKIAADLSSIPKQKYENHLLARSYYGQKDTNYESEDELVPWKFVKRFGIKRKVLTQEWTN